MIYEFTAHDRGLELLWKPGSTYSLFLCPEHGLYVGLKDDLFTKCYCGYQGAQHIPERYQDKK